MADFYKLNGTGNDFVVLDCTTNSSSLEKAHTKYGTATLSELALAACHRETGIGADGLVILNRADSETDLRWDFYNNDGSEAEMCGNAARCVAWLYLKKLSPGTLQVTLLTTAGVITGRFTESNLTKINMTEIKDFNLGMEVQTDETYTVDYIDSGVPHAVIQLDHFENGPESKTKFSKIRNHQVFQPRGANATYFKVVDENSIESASFERGVEDFTQACGTGAVAAAFSYAKSKSEMPDQVKVKVPGGLLIVHFENETSPLLEGPVELEFEGQWES